MRNKGMLAIAAIVAVVAVGGIGFAAFGANGFVYGTATASGYYPVAWDGSSLTAGASAGAPACSIATTTSTDTPGDSISISMTGVPGASCAFSGNLYNEGAATITTTSTIVSGLSGDFSFSDNVGGGGYAVGAGGYFPWAATLNIGHTASNGESTTFTITIGFTT